MSTAEFFCETYPECTRRFARACSQVTARVTGARTGELRVPDDGPALIIPFLFVPATERARNLVLLDSGTHGIEGFTGSAVQCRFLETAFAARPHTAFLFLHGINAWGFANGRRVTRNNVDLNRNSLDEHAAAAEAIARYEKFRGLLHPGRKARADALHDAAFFTRALWLALTRGIRPMRQLAIAGQYHDPEGLFFGGMEPEPHAQVLSDFLVPYTRGITNVLALSVHTGYGRWGHLHFLPGSACNSDKALRAVFDGFVVDYASKEDFYLVRGDASCLIQSTLMDGQCLIPMALEFGTARRFGLASAITALRAMIEENELHFHGAASPAHAARVRSRFRELFYPSDPAWRESVLQQADAALPRLVAQLERLAD